MGKVDLARFASADELANAAAAAFLTQVQPGQCCAFSGGRIAENFFIALARHPSAQKLSNLQYFWADERCVPPDHPDSNYGLMHRCLLKPLGIPTARIHRIKGELDPPIASELASRDLPFLDYIFLGMGEDGHVASIFPGDPEIESDAIYRAVIASKPPPQRITIGLRVILGARHVWVLVSGSGKETPLGKSLTKDPSLPLGRVLAGREFTNVMTVIASK